MSELEKRVDLVIEGWGKTLQSVGALINAGVTAEKRIDALTEKATHYEMRIADLEERLQALEAKSNDQ